MSLFRAEGLVCYFMWLFRPLEQYPRHSADESQTIDTRPLPFLSCGSRREPFFPSNPL